MKMHPRTSKSVKRSFALGLVLLANIIGIAMETMTTERGMSFIMGASPQDPAGRGRGPHTCASVGIRIAAAKTIAMVYIVTGENIPMSPYA
jgi:hypothetical protein